MRRLEREGLTSREDLVDLVVAALDVHDESESGRRFAQAALSFLLVEAAATGPRVEMAQTVVNLAMLLDSRVSGSVGGLPAYHLALALLSQSQPTTNIRRDRRQVRLAAHNMANNLSGIAQRLWPNMPEEQRRRASAAIGPLCRIAAAYSNDAAFEPWLPRVLAAAGFSDVSEDRRLADVVPVALSLGECAPPDLRWNAAGAWVGGLAGIARLATDGEEEAPATLFNTGVTLLRVYQDNAIVARVRVIVNAVGLASAFRTSSDMSTALFENDGVNCAVNLCGAAVDARLAASADPSLHSALGAVLAIARWQPPHPSITFTQERQRLLAAAQALGISVSEPPSRESIISAAQLLIEHGAAHFGKGETGSSPQAHAEVLLFALQQLPIDRAERESVLGLLSELAAARRTTTEGSVFAFLSQEYAPFRSEMIADLRNAPHVRSELIDEVELPRLDAPPTEIAPMLRDYAPESGQGESAELTPEVIIARARAAHDQREPR